MSEVTLILVSALTTLTAVVAFATKIVEYHSARNKHKSETQTPIPTTPISVPSQHTFKPFSFIFYMVVRWFSLITIVVMVFGADHDKPATLEQVGLIGICVANMILFDIKFNE